MAEIYIGNNQIGGGGSADLSNYYNKSEIDSSFADTYLVKITNSAGYYCYVPRTMSAADREYVLSKLDKNGGVVKFAYPSSTIAQIGNNSNSAGQYTRATGSYSHAEGSYTTASGPSSHAQGSDTKASGNYSHAEGSYTTASGSSSHAEGYYTNAKQQYQHAEGKFNSDASNAILIVGNGTGAYSTHNALEVHLSGEVKIPDTHSAGEAYEKPMFVLQDRLHSIDSSITALEANSGGGEVDLSVINASVNNIENDYVKSEDIANFITSSYTYDKAHIDASFIELAENSGSADLSNYYNKSEIDSSFADTYLVKITNASGYYCYVPRTMSDADRERALSNLNKNGGVVKTVRKVNNAFIGANCHAEGSECRARGDYSHAEGYRTTASGNYSHAEGSNTDASSGYSHAEGSQTKASGSYSHAEGYSTTASGNSAHAEGSNTTASGLQSHAEGYYTYAKQQYQHAEGQYNLDASTAILIVGNGISNTRHNALEIHLSGDVKIPDTYGSGEAHQKPMYVLQDRIHSIDTSINNINASVNYLSGMQSAVLSNVNFVVMNEVDYELITPDPSIIYFLT